jgi:hypothetical protein
MIGDFAVVDGDFELALSGLRRVHPELTGLADNAVASFSHSDQSEKSKSKPLWSTPSSLSWTRVSIVCKPVHPM